MRLKLPVSRTPRFANGRAKIRRKTPMPKNKFEGGGLGEGGDGERFRSTVERDIEVVERDIEAVIPSQLEQRPATVGDARKILKENFFGRQDASRLCLTFEQDDSDERLPFSVAELQRAKDLGHQLIYQAQSLRHMSRTFPILPETTQKLTLRSLKHHDHSSITQKNIWRPIDSEYRRAHFYKNEPPRGGWRLVIPEPLPGSFNLGFYEQLDLLSEYLKTQVYTPSQLPIAYARAILAYEDIRQAYAGRNISQTEHEQRIASSELVSFFCERPVEVGYRLLLQHVKNMPSSLKTSYVRTSSISLKEGPGNARVLYIGSASAGIAFGHSPVGVPYPNIGISFSYGPTTS